MFLFRGFNGEGTADDNFDNGNRIMILTLEDLV
jgi:hypothetical protein